MNETLQTLSVLFIALLWGGQAHDLLRRFLLNETALSESRLLDYLNLVLAALIVILVIAGGLEVGAVLAAIFWAALIGLQIGLLIPTLQKAGGKGGQAQLAYLLGEGFAVALGAILLAVVVNA
jgi:hypothetical protein